jgi:hypothetical protein
MSRRPTRARRNPKQTLVQRFDRAAKKALKPYLTTDPEAPSFFREGGANPGYVHVEYALRQASHYWEAWVPHFEAHLEGTRALATNKRNVENMERVAETMHWPVVVFSYPELGNEAAFSSKWVYLGKPRREWGRGPRDLVGLDTWIYVPGAPASKKLYKTIAEVLSLPSEGRMRVIETRLAAELAKYHFPGVPEEYQEAVARLLTAAYDANDSDLYRQAKELAALVAE